MASPNDVPRVSEPIAAAGGYVTRAWVDFFLKLASSQSNEDLAALYAALAQRVSDLEDGTGFDFQILGQGSIGVNGIPQSGGVVIITLLNDVDSPGNTMYYGTGPTGTKGWFSIASSLDVTADLTKSVAGTGVTTFGLSNLTDSGTGTLLATTFDAKGRRIGSKPATITGTTNQISVANGNAAAGLPTLSLAAPILASLAKADSALQPGAAHNTSLSGLQGGTSGQYYHSTAAQNAALAAISISGYINGFRMVWNSGTSVSFDSGTATIQSTGTIMTFPSAITKAGLALAGSTFYHCYAYSNAGTPDIEIVTTVPAAPYNGTARSKTGDASRRYIGSLLTDTSGNVRRFVQSDTEVSYLDTLGVVPYRILAAGAATTPTAVSVLPAAPITAAQFKGQLINNVATGFFVISAPGGMLEIISVAPNTRVVQYLPIFNSQMFYYNTMAGGSSFIDLHAYVFER